jgi:photosystem II stability/assembly factor-like uncharacterized protein
MRNVNVKTLFWSEWKKIALIIPLLLLVVILILSKYNSIIPLIKYSESPPIDWREITPIDQLLTSVVFAQNQFVAVGDIGTIVTSTDGIQWVQQHSGTTGNLKDIAYGKGKYVAVGNQGTILFSSNGLEWKEIKLNNEWFNMVTYGNGLFITINSYGSMFTSSNGEDWKEHEAGKSIRFKMNDIIYADDRFIAVGAASYGITSSDGENWIDFKGENKRHIGIGADNSFHYLAYGNNLFVATAGSHTGSTYGLIFRSKDGLHWKRVVQLEDTPLGVTYGDEMFVAVGSSMVYTTTDGYKWKSFRLKRDQNLRDVAYGNDRFVAVGYSGIILVSD